MRNNERIDAEHMHIYAINIDVFGAQVYYGTI